VNKNTLSLPVQFSKPKIQPNEGHILPANELKKLTELFSILIQIDQKNKRHSYENKTN